MLYISKRVGDMFEVTDTEDGVSETVTLAKLRDIVYSGVVVEGTHYGTKSELKTKGFWKVEPLGNLYIIKLSCGNFYEVTYKTRDNRTLQAIGCLRIIDTSYKDLCTMILFDNSIVKFYYKDIVSVKPFIQKDIGLKVLMDERIQLSNLLAQKEAQAKLLDSEIRELRNQINLYSEKFSNHVGVWTKSQFIDYLNKHLSNVLHKYNFLIEDPSNVLIKNTDVCISYIKNVGSSYNCNLFEREYDGALVYRRNYKDMDEYKRVIRAYHTTIPNCKLPYEEGIALGDGRYFYQAWYTISLEGKTLNEALAKEVLKMVGV